MKDYILKDKWKIIEEGFDAELHQCSESLFSLGNGHMGQRANFEEEYSGPYLPGNYIAGIYYPDKTKVGWWKNGYPEYFAKVINSPNWIGIDINVNGKKLDLFRMKVHSFRRELNMKEGVLYREFEASWQTGEKVRVKTRRFLSMFRRETGALEYKITPLNFRAELNARLYINGDVRNRDANYDEKFWIPVSEEIFDNHGYISIKTKKTNFEVCAAMHYSICIMDKEIEHVTKRINENKYIAFDVSKVLEPGVELKLEKIVAISTSRDYKKRDLSGHTMVLLNKAVVTGFQNLLIEHKDAWAGKWSECDVIIEGDISAQQGIRFNIFQLHQTYTGHDARLNIGPKGFTGEKYGGSTYWDTEAYCLPFYLNTAGSSVAKNLLLYRYNQLDKAIENAEKLGFKNGAALFPMVTMNGEECHNEWEITFEEIHRNGAIAYAINKYIIYSGDQNYMTEYGLEVLIALSRFWAQRVNYSDVKKMYVLLGVTGPNEYENNVNNNWYTNYIARWTLSYTIEELTRLKEFSNSEYQRIIDITRLDYKAEISFWESIISNIFLPEDKELGIFLQQEAYLDKEQILANDLHPNERPINQNWSWDRILRSCLIKQADVLQGLYFFEDHFNHETIKRNFEFYEGRTVHESSLSPCVHSIIAARLNMPENAYSLYLRTSRNDLDDYNNEVSEGCHITSMAGTWLSIVEGFGGMRVHNNNLCFSPVLPDKWSALCFTICFRNFLISLRINHQTVELFLKGSGILEVYLYKKLYKLSEYKPLVFKMLNK